MTKEEYQEYLNSPEWKAVRAAALERGDNKCAVCGRRDTLQVHHNCYDRIGAESPTDLVVLCAYHHLVFHDCQSGDEQGLSKMSRECLESHIRCLIEAVRAIDRIIDPHYRSIARVAVINYIVDMLHVQIDPGDISLHDT
jgi:hypothetical protein